MAITISGLTQKVLSLLLVRKVDIDENQKRKAIQELIPTVIDEVLTSHLWDFVMDEATHSGGTIADEANYTFEGNNSDCRDVITVKYDDAENVLEERDTIDMEEWLTDRTHNRVNFWIMDGRVNKFPRIKIIATPSTAGIQIKYRYAKNNVTLSDFPDEFESVLIAGLAAWMVPQYIPRFEKQIDKMIDNFSVSGGGDRPAKVDRYMVMLNNRRSRKYGWGG